MKYRVNVVDVRRWNNFSGNAFRSKTSLVIKVQSSGQIQPQEQSNHVILQKFKNHTAESDLEAKYYMESNDWDLSKAIAAWEQDNEVPACKPAHFSRTVRNTSITQAGPIAVVGEPITYIFTEQVVQAESEIVDGYPSTVDPIIYYGA